MSQEPATPQALIKLLERGVDKCAQRLGRLSYSTWNVDTVSLSSGASAAPGDLMGASNEKHFGTFLGIPGGGFLVIFPEKSGFLVTNRFTLSGADPVDALPNRESTVLAEVSNIIINALTDVLAEACGKTLMLSAPEPIQGPKKEILQSALGRFSQAGKLAWICYVRLKTPTFSSHCDLVAFLDSELFRLLSGGQGPAVPEG